MKVFGSVGAVAAAIDDEAQAEIERLERETADTIARLTREMSHPIETPDRERRLGVARAAAREQLAHQDYLDARADLELREQWIERVVDEARRRIRRSSGMERRERLTRLAEAALRQVPTDDCVIQVSAEDLWLADESWLRHRAAITGKLRVTVETGDVESGCVARSRDGRMAFDNTLAARSARTASAWRMALAAIFDTARR